MKSLDESTLPAFHRSDAEAVVETARRAADPDYYVQKATGRALTKALAVVIGLQVGGVFLWLVLVFVGLMDATENLNEFLISQLVVFMLSVFIGIGWILRHVRELKEDAEELEPGVVRPLLKRLDPGIDVDTDGGEPPPDGVDGELFDDVANSLEVRWSAATTFGDAPYQLWELIPPAVDTEGDEGEAALLFVARGSPDVSGEKTVVRSEDGADGIDLDPLPGSRLGAALRAFDAVVEETGGEFSLTVEDQRVVLTLRHDTLLVDDDATVDEVHRVGRQIATALGVMRAVDGR